MGPARKVGFARYLFGEGYRPAAARALQEAWARHDVRFGTRFVALSVLAWAICTFTSDFSYLAGGTAAAVAWSTRASGLPAAAGPDGVVSFANGAFSYRIDADCTGIYVALMYVAAVVAYPAAWRRRGVGILVGIPTLFLLNVGRLVSMAWLGVRFPSIWHDAHVYWWQVFFIVTVALGWLAWAKSVADGSGGRVARAREALVAVGAFFGVFLGAVAAAAFTPAARVYVRALMAAAAPVARAVWDPTGPLQLTMHPLWWFGALAGVLSLFAATPRVSWRRRLSGAASWGIVPLVLMQVLTMAWWSVPSPDPGSAVFRSLGGAMQMVIPVALWFAWVRRHGTDSSKKLYECPHCRGRFGDVLGHVRVSHKRKASAIRRDLLAEHPDLEDPGESLRAT